MKDLSYYEWLIDAGKSSLMISELEELERKLKYKEKAIEEWERECQRLEFLNEEVPLLKGLLNKRIEDLQSNTIETLQFDLKIAHETIQKLDEENKNQKLQIEQLLKLQNKLVDMYNSEAGYEIWISDGEIKYLY